MDEESVRSGWFTEAIRRLWCGWARSMGLLLAAILLGGAIFVVFCLFHSFIDKLQNQNQKMRAAALRRCLDEASLAAPGESADSLFRKWKSGLTLNLSQEQRERLQRCLDGELRGVAAVNWSAALPPAAFAHAPEEAVTVNDLKEFYKDWWKILQTMYTFRPHNKSIEPLITEQLRRCLGGVVTVEEFGRFGNWFLAWASAWAVARTHNLTLATPTSTHNILQKAFKNVPTGLTVTARLRKCSFGYGLVEGDVFRTVEGTNDTEAVAAFAAAVANASSAASAPGPLVLQSGVVLATYIARVATELRAQMVWRDQFSDMVQTKLRHFGKITAAMFRVPLHTVVFVGVHVRRKDYSKYLRKRLNLTLEATVPYYLRAVRHLSRTLDAEAGGRHSAGPLALVVSSDDMNWVRDELLFAFHNLSLHEAIRLAAFVGSVGDIWWSYLEDLALLSACNHSIISYGTYGITAGLLAGGHVVAFELKSDYHTSQIANVLPSWSVLR